MKGKLALRIFGLPALEGEASYSILFITIGMVAMMAMIANLIDTYIKDKFLAILIIFAIASIVLAVGLILYILYKRSAQRKAQSKPPAGHEPFYFVFSGSDWA
jgi:dipeptide/tripeptide permease